VSFGGSVRKFMGFPEMKMGMVKGEDEDEEGSNGDALAMVQWEFHSFQCSLFVFQLERN
jgi:hypothetical protein